MRGRAYCGGNEEYAETARLHGYRVFHQRPRYLCEIPQALKPVVFHGIFGTLRLRSGQAIEVVP